MALGPDWYREGRQRWIDRPEPAGTFGDLFDIAACLRFAAESPQQLDDLEFWIDRLGPLVASDNPDLVQATQMEIIVARAQAQGDLRPAEHLLIDLVTSAIGGNEPRRLARAVDAHSMAVHAWFSRQTGLSARTLEDLAQQLSSCLDGLLNGDLQPAGRCTLLNSVAILNMRFSPLGAEESAGAATAHAHSRITGEPRPAREDRAAGSPEPVDAGRALAAWHEMVRLLDAAPLFPLQATAELIDVWVAWLIDHPSWTRFVTDLDAALERIASAQAAMHAGRRRAEALLAADRPARALDELCRLHLLAKKAGDVRMMIGAIVHAARCYQRLGLLYAAKHYALSATALAGAQPEEYGDLTAEAVIVLANGEFLAGNWLNFLGMYHTVVQAHGLWRENANDPRAWDDIGDLVIKVVFANQIAAFSGNPRLAAAADDLLRSAATNVDRLPKLITNDTLDAFRRDFLAATGQPMFADTGDQRTISWSALGIDWTIRCANTYREIGTAERLASALQAFQAAGIDEDFLLLPAQLDITIAGPPAAERIVWADELAASGAAPLVVHLQPWTPTTNPLDVTTTLEALNTVLDLFRSLSLHDAATIEETIGRVLTGLDIKTLPNTSYDAAYGMLNIYDFDAATRQVATPIGQRADTPPVIHPSIAAPTAPGPGYTAEKAEHQAQVRYEGVPAVLNRTLPHLSGLPPFQETVADLRLQGWKDWHILQALADLNLNLRVADKPDPLDAALTALSNPAGETDDDILIPAELANAMALQVFLFASLPAAAADWGLHPPRLPRELCNLDWILQLLADRYAYLTTDASHDDPFTSR